MKSVALVPYCPLPANSGARAEMMWHLNILRELGPCTVVSAGTFPVGGGWSLERIDELRKHGFEIALREDSQSKTPAMLFGSLYATICKALGLERAFGHSNPYHRYAFPPAWWRKRTESADIAFINYSYWARLPCECPKTVHIHDLWSDIMWEKPERETSELQSADLVLTLSIDEERKLRGRGVNSVVWMPPSLPPVETGDSDDICVVGSDNAFNREGLAWLAQGLRGTERISVYGGLSNRTAGASFVPCGSYADRYLPFKKCGIVLIPTAGGTGVQIKCVEALACGKAIVARKGAMRGLPAEGDAWIEVSSPGDMTATMARLRQNRDERQDLARKAADYHNRFLDATKSKTKLLKLYSATTLRAKRQGRAA